LLSLFFLSLFFFLGFGIVSWIWIFCMQDRQFWFGFLFFSGDSVNYCDLTYCWSLGFGFWVGMVLEVLF
jgi:hypothetical protein